MTEPTAPTERTDPQCIARPSPFKVNGDQSTDGGSGHGALHTQKIDTFQIDDDTPSSK